jgi:hypothetical protein
MIQDATSNHHVSAIYDDGGCTSEKTATRKGHQHLPAHDRPPIGVAVPK